MGDEKYQLMYSGLAEGVDEANVKTLIHERFRMPMASIERWFGKQRAVIGRELSQDQAWKTQYLFESMGVQTIVVLQTRSNLALNSLQMEAADARPAVTVNRFQPNGMVEFEARPVSRQHRVSPARRRPRNTQPAEKSLKLSHMVAAAIVVAVVSYGGKQLVGEHSPVSHALASFTD